MAFARSARRRDGTAEMPSQLPSGSGSAAVLECKRIATSELTAQTRAAAVSASAGFPSLVNSVRSAAMAVVAVVARLSS